jgi:hypothetical protein
MLIEDYGESFYETKMGTKYWYLHGELHRVDGPAVIYADGTFYIDGNKRYCLYGVLLSYDEWKEKVKCL